MKHHIFSILALFLFAACASTGPDQVAPKVETTPGGVGTMDALETEMRESLGESVSIRREGGLLALTLKGELTFQTGSSELNPGLLPTADRIAAVLKRYPQTVLRVEGHTDNQGADTYNLRLSGERAENVKSLLVERQVDASRITATPFGETMPVAPNLTEEGRIRNRRVEIKIEASNP